MINAMQVMREKGMKRAAMVKNGQLVGMLTEEAAKKLRWQLKQRLHRLFNVIVSLVFVWQII